MYLFPRISEEKYVARAVKQRKVESLKPSSLRLRASTTLSLVFFYLPTQIHNVPAIMIGQYFKNPLMPMLST